MQQNPAPERNQSPLEGGHAWLQVCYTVLLMKPQCFLVQPKAGIGYDNICSDHWKRSREIDMERCSCVHEINSTPASLSDGLLIPLQLPSSCITESTIYIQLFSQTQSDTGMTRDRRPLHRAGCCWRGWDTCRRTGWSRLSDSRESYPHQIQDPSNRSAGSFINEFRSNYHSI